MSNSIGAIGFSGINLGNIGSYNSISNNKISKIDKIIPQNTEIKEEDGIFDFVNEDFVDDKFRNVAVWAFTKDIYKEFAAACANVNLTNSMNGIMLLAIWEGVYKSALKGEEINSSVFASGFTKAFTSNTTKLGLSKFSMVENFMKSKSLDGMVKKYFSDVKDFKEFTKHHTLGDLFKINPTFKNTYFTNVVGNMGISIGIDYGATIAANYVSALIKGEEINADTLKAGETVLRSSTKLIFATAGEIIFGKPGKIVGTALGAFIAEFQVGMFDGDEGWCAIAGGAQIVGAVAGAAIVVFLVSNPAGWMVGLALIAGAAVGFLITFVAYKIEAVISWLADAYESCCAFVSDAWDATVDFVSDAWDATVDFVSDAWDTTVDGIEYIVDSNPVTEFLLGWMFA